MINFRFFKPTVEKSGDNDKILNGSKKVKELEKGLTQLTKLCKTFLEKGEAHSKTTAQLGEALLQFHTKEGELKDAGFMLAMQKFADIFVDVATLETYYCQECNNFISNVTALVNDIEQNWKRLFKAYEKARTAYDKQRGVVVQEKEAKKLAVVKLYQAEKERAKLYAEYMKAMHAIEVYCDEVDDKLSFTFVEFLTQWFAAQRNMLGLSYAEFDEIKYYLLELQAWCKEEDRVCEEQRQERERERKKLHEQQNEAHKRSFVAMFNWELISSVLDAIDIEINPQARSQVAGAFVSMLSVYDIPVPPEISTAPAYSRNEAFQFVATWCKENFDAIGLKLLEKGQAPVMITFGDNLAALEKLP